MEKILLHLIRMKYLKMDEEEEEGGRRRTFKWEPRCSQKTGTTFGAYSGEIKSNKS